MQTPQPSATPVPTNTEAPTATPPPPTATRLPTSTSVPTSTPAPVYPSNPYERLAALRSYHLQFSVQADVFSYSVAGDEATPAYHVTVTAPPVPPMELYFVSGHHYYGQAGAPFVDNGTTPPFQAAGLEAAESYARDWFDHPDAAAFKAAENVNGVRANHFVLTWKPGRQVNFEGLTATSSGTASADVWLDATSAAIVKTSFSMGVTSAAGLSQVSANMDVTNINGPIVITPPPVAAASGPASANALAPAPKVTAHA